MTSKRDGSVISDEMRDDCAAYTAGWMTKAAYEAASAAHHAELDVLLAESRQQQVTYPASAAMVAEQRAEAEAHPGPSTSDYHGHTAPLPDWARAACRQQQDRALAEHRAQADREAGARREREPQPGAIPRAHMARVIRDLDVPGYTEPDADREAGQ